MTGDQLQNTVLILHEKNTRPKVVIQYFCDADENVVWVKVAVHLNLFRAFRGCQLQIRWNVIDLKPVF